MAFTVVTNEESAFYVSRNPSSSSGETQKRDNEHYLNDLESPGVTLTHITPKQYFISQNDKFKKYDCYRKLFPIHMGYLHH